MQNDYSVLINGTLCGAASGDTSEVINPANGQVIASVPKCSPAEIEQAADAAWAAAPSWAAKSPGERARVLFKLAGLIRDNHDYLYRLETAQYGGPVFKRVKK